MSKQAAKNELQKLKSLTESTEVWSRRVHKFWQSTEDVCMTACKSFVGEGEASFQLKTDLRECSEMACQCVENVKNVAQNRYIELSRIYQQDKGKCKQRVGCCLDIARRTEDAEIEISTAVFTTFQSQMDRMETLLQSVTAFQRRQLELKPVAVRSDSAAGDSLEAKKRDISSDENNIELDWDAFDRDLAAMSDAVGKLGEPCQRRDDEEIERLKNQLRQEQRENGALMKRVILAEHALESSEKHNAELLSRLGTGFNQDDFLEVRKALKQEQMARLDAEQRLKDAREEIKAAQFAFKVAKAVANRIADSAEIHPGNLPRCNSEIIGNRIDPVGDTSSVDTSHETASIHRGVESEMDVTRVARSDSAYFGEKRSPEEIPEASSNPFINLPEHSTTDISEESDIDTNPFLLDTDASLNPFLVTDATLESNDGLCQGDRIEESNPFLKEERTETKNASSEWNPFVSTSTNPFLV